MLIARILDALGATWVVRCDACARPGRRGDRREVVQLTALHNRLVHRGHPVASAGLELVIR